MPLKTNHPNGALLIKSQDSQAGTEFSVGIQIHPWVASHLTAFGSWGKEWSAKQVAAFCVAAEEVSHFRYFLFRLNQSQPVSQLELEFQGEIDKFLILYFAIAREGSDPSEAFNQLYEKVFEDFHLADKLTNEEKERYLHANQMAKLYINTLRPSLQNRSQDAALRTLRRFYRQSQHDRFALKLK